MSWRTGSKLFAQMWPLIQASIPDREHRIEFTTELLTVFLRNDMDPADVDGIHPDVDEAMESVDIYSSGDENYEGGEET